MSEIPSMFSMVRSASRTRLPTTPESRARARRRFLVLGPLHGIVWALVGYVAVVGILDIFRVMTLNPVDMWDTASSAAIAPKLAFFGLVMLGSPLGFWAMWSAMTAYGTFSLGNRASYGFSLTGVGAGLLVAAILGTWTSPAQVGSSPASALGGGAAWQWWEWAVYYAPIGLPVLFLVLGLANAVSFLLSNRRSEEEQHTEEQVRATGRHTPGQLTKVAFTHTWLMGQPQFEVEVAYFGHAGPCRISQMVVAQPTEAPQVGDPVDVWYDPMNPSKVVINVSPAARPNMMDSRLFMPWG